MANHCMNWINVYSYGMDMTAFGEAIAEAIQTNETGGGWLPEGDEVGLDYPHYLFDISDYTQDKGYASWNCWTKWSPPLEELCRLSARFMGLEFYLEWDESGMGLYGRCVIKDGAVQHLIELDDKDLAQVTWDDEMGVYLWRKEDGSVEEWESDSDIFSQMLDDK